MDWKKELYAKEEKPLDRLVDAYSYTSIFRKIAFIGDSLSSGEFETEAKYGERRWHDVYEYSWGQYIARKNGLTAYNFSKGGMTARDYMDHFAERKGFWSPDLAAQAYVIAMGVNDLFWRGFELGSIDDIDIQNWKNNKPTFAGYYGQIISRYKEIAPDSKFFLVTFPKIHYQEDKVPGMIELLYQIAEKFENCYVIDLYKYGPDFDDEFNKNFNLLGHHNPMGYIVLARLVDSYIDYIIRHNPKDFMHVGFINTDIKYKD
jgi:hypothetical protein